MFKYIAIGVCVGVAVAPTPFIPLSVRAMFLIAAIGYASKR